MDVMNKLPKEMKKEEKKLQNKIRYVMYVAYYYFLTL